MNCAAKLHWNWGSKPKIGSEFLRHIDFSIVELHVTKRIISNIISLVFTSSIHFPTVSSKCSRIFGTCI
jgi:hypothetical protein